jgi:hypothetical protein
VRGLFHLADARLPDAGVEILNMRAETAGDLLARVGLDVGSGAGATPPEAPA